MSGTIEIGYYTPTPTPSGYNISGGTWSGSQATLNLMDTLTSPPFMAGDWVSISGVTLSDGSPADGVNGNNIPVISSSNTSVVIRTSQDTYYQMLSGSAAVISPAAAPSPPAPGTVGYVMTQLQPAFNSSTRQYRGTNLAGLTQYFINKITNDSYGTSIGASIYAGSAFIIMSNNTRDLLFSIDAVNWYQTQPISYTNWSGASGLAYGNNTWIAAGSQGVLRSLNGSGWAQTLNTYSPAGLELSSVAYGADKFVAVAIRNRATGNPTNQAYYSSDGAANTWSAATLTATQRWTSIAFGNGLFVAVGSNVSAASNDGLSWASNVALPSINTDWGWTVRYGAGVFVAIQNSVATSNVAVSDGGATTWTTITLPETVNTSSESGGQALNFVNNQFVLVDNSGVGNIFTSANGRSWTQTGDVGVGSIQSILYR